MACIILLTDHVGTLQAKLQQLEVGSSTCWHQIAALESLKLTTIKKKWQYTHALLPTSKRGVESSGMVKGFLEVELLSTKMSYPHCDTRYEYVSM